MDVVRSIFETFGGVSALAEATGFPQQTVSEWRNRSPAEIPPWRRPAVADAARRLERALSPEALAYLASRERTPKAQPVASVAA
ncbi:MAG: hypothetical protein PGN16_04335 [Sphingomonas phyllosphaerae]|uniref:carph-isopro domain-containing protein n=1 Tax=Sphingomonas phyllosphaerae TaxID=257003 RepID=UPI002FF84C26